MTKKRTQAKRLARKAEHLDVRVGKAVAQLRDRPLIRRIASLGELADQPPLYALAAGTLVAGVAIGRPRLARVGFRMLAAEALATLAKSAIKHHVDRQRPHVQGGDHKTKPGRIVDESAHNSFPSGHSAGAVAVARAVTRDYPEEAAASAALATFAVGAQMPAAKHFPIDVAVGTVIGLAAEAIVSRLMRDRDAPSVAEGA